MIKIAIITNIIPSYRMGFYDRLFMEKDIHVTVFCQNSVPNSNLKSIHLRYNENVHIINYLSIFNGQIIWQKIPYRLIITSFDIVYVDGNPRNLSQAIFASLLKLLGKKVVIWSVANSRNNNSLTIKIRLFWWRLFDYFLMYNDNDIKFLKELNFNNKVIISINNGLDQKNIDLICNSWPKERIFNWLESKKINNRKIILSSGRVFFEKYSLMLQALPFLVEKLPSLLWCIIGDGEDKAKIQKIVADENLEKYVLFIGELYDEEQLAPWFLSSNIFIHPAPIGLSLLHAFGYGLPVITHNNSKIQGPEYIAFRNGETGLSYIDGNVENFFNAILKLLSDKNELTRMGSNAKRTTRINYNVDIMVSRFIEITQKASKLNLD